MKCLLAGYPAQVQCWKIKKWSTSAQDTLTMGCKLHKVQNRLVHSPQLSKFSFLQAE